MGIETLRVGDRVRAVDPETGEAGYYPITWTTHHTATAVIAITIVRADSAVPAGIADATTLGSRSGSSSGPSGTCQ